MKIYPITRAKIFTKSVTRIRIVLSAKLKLLFVRAFYPYKTRAKIAN